MIIFSHSCEIISKINITFARSYINVFVFVNTPSFRTLSYLRRKYDTDQKNINIIIPTIGKGHPESYINPIKKSYYDRRIKNDG